LTAGIGVGTGVVIEVTMRETVGTSGISENRETFMVITGIEETTAGQTIVETDGRTTVPPTSERAVVKSHLRSLREMYRRSRKRSLLVSNPGRPYLRNMQMPIRFTTASQAMSLSLALVHTARCSKAFMSTLNAWLRSRRFEWKAKKMASP
jgi:hypothetical protein